MPTEGIQVNGDSGNDAELFEAPGVYGCIVGNAMEELVHWADAHPGERIYRCALFLLFGAANWNLLLYKSVLCVSVISISTEASVVHWTDEHLQRVQLSVLVFVAAFAKSVACCYCAQAGDRDDALSWV